MASSSSFRNNVTYVLEQRKKHPTDPLSYVTPYAFVAIEWKRSTHELRDTRLNHRSKALMDTFSKNQTMMLTKPQKSIVNNSKTLPFSEVANQLTTFLIIMWAIQAKRHKLFVSKCTRATRDKLFQMSKWLLYHIDSSWCEILPMFNTINDEHRNQPLQLIESKLNSRAFILIVFPHVFLPSLLLLWLLVGLSVKYLHQFLRKCHLCSEFLVIKF